MTTDRINQTIVLKDERRLGFAEYGDASGSAVFHFNGSGGSRLEHPTDLSILTDLGVRLISTDRPGHGISDPQPGRKLLDWPDDIGQLADHLGVDKFYVEGWSAGGAHALACAYKLPERVLAGALISGLAPPDRPNPYEGLPVQNRMLMTLSRKLPSSVFLLRRMMYPKIVGDPKEAGKTLASSFPPVDRALAEIPEYNQMLIPDIQEGYRQGWEGPSQDDIIINSSWGFRLEDIQTRFDVWQGEVDKNVPVNQGEYQDELLPNSRLTILPGQAHLYLLTHWREILEALVT
ncbi:MAG: alpha/beta fold hydrolase [Anaerolineales bacterium]